MICLKHILPEGCNSFFSFVLLEVKFPFVESKVGEIVLKSPYEICGFPLTRRSPRRPGRPSIGLPRRGHFVSSAGRNLEYCWEGV